MKHYKALALAVGLTLAAGCSLPVSAEGPAKRPGGPVQMQEALSTLDLSADQQTKIDAIVEEMNASAEASRSSGQRPDRAQHKAFMDKINAVLTDEQRQQLEELRPKRR